MIVVPSYSGPNSLTVPEDIFNIRAIACLPRQVLVPQEILCSIESASLIIITTFDYHSPNYNATFFFSRFCKASPGIVLDCALCKFMTGNLHISTITPFVINLSTITEITFRPL